MGSGSIIDAFIQVVIHKASYSPLSGSTYIKLPAYLENKQACINIKNKDNECFRHCICAHILQRKHNTERPYTKEQLNKINIEGVELPVKVCSNVYKKIERQMIFLLTFTLQNQIKINIQYFLFI